MLTTADAKLAVRQAGILRPEVVDAGAQDDVVVRLRRTAPAAKVVALATTGEAPLPAGADALVCCPLYDYSELAFTIAAAREDELPF